MKVLIFLILYILIGCAIDLLITKGTEKPNVAMVTVWPMFLLVCVIIALIEPFNKNDKGEEYE